MNKPTDLKATRKEFFEKMEARLKENGQPDDSPFYYHPNEEHIVLSHALFWVMSKPFATQLPNNHCFLLLRQYEEEMLEAYLTEDEDFPELLKYCNILYQTFPIVLKEYVTSERSARLTRKLSAIHIVAGGFGGDIDTQSAYDLLDNIDFNRYGKVVCPEIERMLPILNQMVEEEMKELYRSLKTDSHSWK